MGRNNALRRCDRTGELVASPRRGHAKGSEDRVVECGGPLEVVAPEIGVRQHGLLSGSERSISGI